MKRNILKLAAPIGVALFLAIAPSVAAESWLHITVDERGAGGEKVRVNVPISLLENLAPVLQEIDIKMDKVEMGDTHMDAAKLREIWKALRTAADGEYVTVESEKENVRVAKAGEYMLVKVVDRGEDNETVDVRMPLAIVDALMSGEGDRLNFTAAVKALKDRGEGELVAVKDHTSSVRIWIDGKNTDK